MENFVPPLLFEGGMHHFLSSFFISVMWLNRLLLIVSWLIVELKFQCLGQKFVQGFWLVCVVFSHFFVIFKVCYSGNHFQELSLEGDCFTPSDVERALWSSAVATKLQDSQPDPRPKVNTNRQSKRKRNQ